MSKLLLFKKFQYVIILLIEKLWYIYDYKMTHNCCVCELNQFTKTYNYLIEYNQSYSFVVDHLSLIQVDQVLAEWLHKNFFILHHNDNCSLISVCLNITLFVIGSILLNEFLKNYHYRLDLGNRFVDLIKRAQCSSKFTYLLKRHYFTLNKNFADKSFFSQRFIHFCKFAEKYSSTSINSDVKLAYLFFENSFDFNNPLYNNYRSLLWKMCAKNDTDAILFSLDPTLFNIVHEMPFSFLFFGS